MVGRLSAVPSGGSGTPEATREAVLRAAATLLAADASASLAEIGAAAGVGRTTVHRAFPTRSDLLTALALDAVDRLREAIASARLDDGSAPEAVERVVESVLPLADELRFLEAGPEVWDLPELQDAWWDITASLDALVERGQREGTLRPDVPAEVVVEAFVGMLWGVWQGVHDGRVARASASRHLVTLALAAVATPKGAAAR
jgi:AcrR family transcriptional regulator